MNKGKAKKAREKGKTHLTKLGGGERRRRRAGELLAVYTLTAVARVDSKRLCSC